jgi:hypothetical protein
MGISALYALVKGCRCPARFRCRLGIEGAMAQGKKGNSDGFGEMRENGKGDLGLCRGSGEQNFLHGVEMA